MPPVVVNVDNFVRAETDRMFAAMLAEAGGVNQWLHYRAPTPVDKQTVIRMNRDTLYSAAVVDPRLPSGEYQLTVRDVPVDGFWSISVYNADGYFQPNDRDAYSVNNITAGRNDDGSVTVCFGGCDGARPNCLPIPDGWNYTVRLYRPRPEILDGTWTCPALTPAE